MVMAGISAEPLWSKKDLGQASTCLNLRALVASGYSMYDCINGTRVDSQVASCRPGDHRSMLVTVVLVSRPDPVSKSKHDTIQA